MDEGLLCGCGHARGEHRMIPQENACPAEGCACTGYHLAGEDEGPPTCLCGGTRGRHRPNCHTLEQ